MYKCSEINFLCCGGGKQLLEHEVTTLELSVSDLPMRYLGLPLTRKSMTKLEYEPLVDQIRARMLNWTSCHLSFAGGYSLFNQSLQVFLIFGVRVHITEALF